MENQAVVYPEELAGERIVIRKARMQDLDSVYRNVYGDKELLRLTFFSVSPDRASAGQRLVRTIAFQKERPLWFIAEKETDEVIGLCGLMKEDDGYSDGGFVIAAEKQRQGYATEMLTVLLRYAFNELKTPWLSYYLIRENEPSRRLALHFGFHYVSESEQIREEDGAHFIVEKYILTAGEYQKTESGDGNGKDENI